MRCILQERIDGILTVYPLCKHDKNAQFWLVNYAGFSCAVMLLAKCGHLMGEQEACMYRAGK